MRSSRTTLLLACLIAGPLIHAASRYVDGTNGNDANDGLSLATAWATIQKSFDSALSGDTVYIRQGTYVEHPVLQVSDVVFLNYPGEEVIIDGDPALGNTILTIEEQSLVTIKGITITGLVAPDAIGVLVRSVHHIRLDSLDVHGIGWTDDAGVVPGPDDNAQPILVLGVVSTSYIVVHQCRVHDNITGYSEAISFDGNVFWFEVSDCDVHDNTNIGIQVGGNYGVASDADVDHARNGRIVDNRCWNNVSNYATSAGIYVDGGWNTFIERNVCEGNGFGIEIGCEENGTTENILMYNNVLRVNHEAGLAIGGYTEQTSGEVLDCFIWNNTFFRNDQDQTGTGELYITKASTCSFRNNAFQPTAQGILLSREDIAPQMNNTFDYNAWFIPNLDPADVEVGWGNDALVGFEVYRNTSGWDANGFFADPLFIDPSIDPPNLALQAGSPCVDSGDPNSTFDPDAIDMSGAPRVSGPGVDIGAYEFQYQDGFTEFPPLSFVITPNPCTTSFRINGLPPGGRIEVRDAWGRLLRTCMSDDLCYMRDLSSGAYIVLAKQDHGPAMMARLLHTE